MKARTIRQQWDTFNALVVPADASAVQRLEMKRAFYCGAQGLLEIEVGLAEANVSEREGSRVLENVHRELQQFARDVKAGSA